MRIESAQQPILTIRNLRKSFGSLEVLKGIDFEVMPRTVTGIIGSSGSGKSTMLRCLNYIERPTAGEIIVDGEHFGVRLLDDGREVALSDRELSRQRRQMSMVFQRFNLWPHMTALQNVTEALTVVMGMERVMARNKGMALLEKVGLADRFDRYPAQLSGGQQQRVGIARALASDPKIMLFDEPTSALDPELVDTVLEVMVDLAKEGRTMLVVTHEMGFARDICDKILFIEAGLIADQGTPDHIFGGTKNPRTLEFLNRYLKQFSA